MSPGGDPIPPGPPRTTIVINAFENSEAVPPVAWLGVKHVQWSSGNLFGWRWGLKLDRRGRIAGVVPPGAVIRDVPVYPDEAPAEVEFSGLQEWRLGAEGYPPSPFRIAYPSPSGRWGLFTADEREFLRLSSGRVVPITDGDAWGEVWSRDESLMGLVRHHAVDRRGSEVHAEDRRWVEVVDTLGIRVVRGPEIDPESVGRRLEFPEVTVLHVGTEAIYYDIGRTRLVRLTYDPPRETEIALPSGKRIISGDGRTVLVYNPFDSTAVLKFYDLDETQTELRWTRAWPGGIGPLEVSPDGGLVAWIANSDPGHEVCLVDGDGREVFRTRGTIPYGLRFIDREHLLMGVESGPFTETTGVMLLHIPKASGTE